MLAEYGWQLKGNWLQLTWFGNPITPDNLFRMPEPEDEGDSDCEETVITAVMTLTSNKKI